MTLADALSLDVEGLRKLSSYTIHMYKVHVNRFVKFCGSDSAADSASDAMVAEYLESLIEKDFHHPWIRQAFCAIRAAHQRLGKPDPCGPRAHLARHRSLLKAKKRHLEQLNEPLLEAEGDHVHFEEYLTTEEAALVLRITRHMLIEKMKATPSHIKKPWIMFAGNYKRPRYRWRSDMLEDWWWDLNDYIYSSVVIND